MKHVYRREIDPTANDSLARIVQFIPPACRVLDVGTGSGALGRFLRTMGCCVDGITYSEEEAMLARDDYAHIEVLDLEKILPSQIFIGQVYDVVVCADILEHLRNPLEVLHDLRSLLATDGSVLLSIPNATYMGVLFELLGGRFVRTQEGILDATHVNFFDRDSLVELVESAGFSIQAISDVRKGLSSSEFSALDIPALPKTIRDYVESRPNTDVYQFVWSLTPNTLIASHANPILPPRPTICIPPQFAAQVFWDFGQGFDEIHSAHAWGYVDQEPQKLVFNFTLPGNPKCLRVDFSDRPGVFEFLSLTLTDSQGNVLFKWHGDWLSALQMNDCEILPIKGPNEGRLFRATSDDPWISFPAESHWHSALRAELIMTSPQRYHDAAFVWAENCYRHTIQTLREQLDSTTKSLCLALAEQASIQQNLAITTVSRDQLLETLNQVQSSTSWRITAGLRRLSAWLRRSN